MHLHGKTSTQHVPGLQFRSARPQDGAALWRLIQATGTLELNSAYFYLLFATDFGRTCLIAHEGEDVVGAVIGYHPPEQARTAFVWQVGLLPRLRGRGLGVELLQHWIDLPANQDRLWVTATVADDNTASQALFKRFAQLRSTECNVQTHFTADLFPIDHPPEPLYRVGPLPRAVTPDACHDAATSRVGVPLVAAD
jgi:L-2,4-diaminobutyric acid acetyltransferase